MSTDKLKLSIIGVGAQSGKYIRALHKSRKLSLTSLVDIDSKVFDALKIEAMPNTFSNLDDMIKEDKPDVALVCVPHIDHKDIIEKLIMNGIAVFKEKPYAISLDEAEFYNEISNQYELPIYSTVKRRHNPLYQAFPSYFKNNIGEIFYVDAKYTKNIDNLGVGWRAKYSQAGGGALMDMGYHFIDLLIWYFGAPEKIDAEMGFNNKVKQVYDVEDTANLLLRFRDQNTGRKIVGSLLISRITAEEREEINIYGTKGFVAIDEHSARLYDSSGALISVVKNEDTFDVNIRMLDELADMFLDNIAPINHTEHVKFIECAYASCDDDDIQMIQDVSERIRKRA